MTAIELQEINESLLVDFTQEQIDNSINEMLKNIRNAVAEHGIDGNIVCSKMADKFLKTADLTNLRILALVKAKYSELIKA